MVVGDILAQNLTEKCDQPITYESQLFHHAKYNYTTTKRKALAMVYALHKFHHYLFKNKFIFYVDHMALLCLVRQPQISGRIARWSLPFSEYDFSVVYKPKRSHWNKGSKMGHDAHKWWPTMHKDTQGWAMMHKDAFQCCQAYDNYQRTRNLIENNKVDA
jgi:hypothetical protein